MRHWRTPIQKSRPVRNMRSGNHRKDRSEKAVRTRCDFMPNLANLCCKSCLDLVALLVTTVLSLHNQTLQRHNESSHRHINFLFFLRRCSRTGSTPSMSVSPCHITPTYLYEPCVAGVAGKCGPSRSNNQLSYLVRFMHQSSERTRGVRKPHWSTSCSYCWAVDSSLTILNTDVYDKHYLFPFLSTQHQHHSSTFPLVLFTDFRPCLTDFILLFSFFSRPLTLSTCSALVVPLMPKNRTSSYQLKPDRTEHARQAKI